MRRTRQSSSRSSRDLGRLSHSSHNLPKKKSSNKSAVTKQSVPKKPQLHYEKSDVPKKKTKLDVTLRRSTRSSLPETSPMNSRKRKSEAARDEIESSIENDTEINHNNGLRKTTKEPRTGVIKDTLVNGSNTDFNKMKANESHGEDEFEEIEVSSGSESDDDIICEDEEINNSEIIDLDSCAGSECSGTSRDVTSSQAQSSSKIQRGNIKMNSNMRILLQKLVSIKREYQLRLEKKEEALKRLENEIKWKDEQLHDMEKLSNKNMELESRINLMLSGKEEYEKEVEKVKEEERKIEEERKREEKMKMEEVEKQTSHEEDNTEETKDDNEPKKKKRRMSRRSLKKDEEKQSKDEIDAYFVDDDSDVEITEKEPTKDIASSEKPTEKETDEKSEEIVTDKSANDNEEKTDDLSSPTRGRHNIRKMMTSTKLQDETKQAAKEERERIERAKKEHDKHIRVDELNRKKEPITKQLVLALKKDQKNPLVEVNQKLIKKLKPHQVDAVEFIWDNIIESMEKVKKNHEGSGCILAHCMGLGKTLSVVTVIHTLLTSKPVGFKRALVLCPLNTVLNWEYELEKWLDKKDRLDVYELISARDHHERTERLHEWKTGGGVMIMGYQLYRILANYSGRSKRTKKIIDDSLIDPGPDVVVCDEGHILKNDASAISKCMNRIRTKRRIVLSGTPLQNNLVEYHCMVNFVKPNLLGSRREFCNRFVNLITNGQHSDSTGTDVKIMKRRAHILHAMLDGCVQRRDYSSLTKFLPPKQEYVISVRLSELQIKLYEKYLELFRPEASSLISGDTVTTGSFKVRGAGLFSDYQNLMRIWTHPWQLKLEEIRQDKKPFTEDDDDELESIIFTSSSEDELEDEESATSCSRDDDPVVLSSDDNNDDKTDEDVTDEEVTLKTRRSSRLKDNDDKEHACKKTKKAKKPTSKNVEQPEREADVKLRESLRSRNKETNDEVKSKKSSRAEKPDNKQNRDNESIASDKSKDTPDDGTNRKAKVIAGEVIRHWQSNSRGTGKEEEFQRKKEDPWWYEFVKDDVRTMVEVGGKLVLMFEILRMAETIGDKVLIFSQSLLTLDIIESFLELKDEIQQNANGKNKTCGRWEKDVDYCRMDGSTVAMSRRKLTHNFNDFKNKRMRLFLISTKAGGLGINLDSANRVIIFDASWNPSHDIQSIFRVYRFGQEKDVFIYRFLAQGTMEEKIYERQVTKETLSQRVIDEHQIDRHFSANDLRELYNFKPDRLDDPNRPVRPTPVVPKDVILTELLSTQKEWIVQYHEHDSLLENRPDENLSEEERQKAWEEYEREKRGLGNMYRTIQPMINMARSQLNMFNRFGAAGSTSEGLPNSSIRIGPTVSDPTKAPIMRTFQGNSMSKLNSQISQLPKVVQEIIRYNPTITSEELSKRLQAFMGMHNRYTQPSNLDGEKKFPSIQLKITRQGPQGSQIMNIALPAQYVPPPASSSTPSTSQGSSTVLPISQNLVQILSGQGPASANMSSLPSRLPGTGSVPADRK